MSLEVRTAGEAEFPDWMRAMNTGFLRPPEASKEEIDSFRGLVDLERTQGAFDDGRCVATFRSFAQELTMVGGARVRSDAISSVTVSPTHRRRGLLGRMMDADLRAAKDRGETVASLVASEYPIYGRYGFGPATWATEWRVDTHRARLDPRYAGPGDGGRVDLVDTSEVRAIGPAFHERFRAGRPGATDRDRNWWRRNTGEVRISSIHPWTEPFHAAYRAADGEVEGLVTYTCSDNNWDGKRPRCTASVSRLLAVTPAAERALWHFVCSIDWIAHVESGLRAPDDLLPLLLGDPRAARVLRHADYLWLRPLDIPRLLQARTYPISASLVLDVRDEAGLAGGRFLLQAAPDGASCAPTTRSADLTLDVAELGTLCLGDESPLRLHALGRVAEERAGALATADALLRTPRRPWCPDMF